MRIASTRRLLQGALACACLLATQSAAAASQALEGMDQAGAVRMFNARVERYARLRARLEEPLPSFDARRDAWSLMLTRRYLASAIRTARRDASQGNVFGPPVAEMFREVIAHAIYDVDVEGLVDGDLEADEFVVDLAVHEPVPAWAMEEVPDALLHRLPSLPAAIEYRIVSGNLILWDTHAEIVIDALPNAFLVQ
jgi:hypothetical protein